MAIWCTGATFEGRATFNSLECKGHGFFGGIQAKSEVDFSYASFGGDLLCTAAMAEGNRTSSDWKCVGTGSFSNTMFGKSVEGQFQGGNVDLSFARFGGNLSLENCRFGGPLDMTAADVSQELTLTGANFGQSVILQDASAKQLTLEAEDDAFIFEKNEDGSWKGSLDLREFTGEFLSQRMRGLHKSEGKILLRPKTRPCSAGTRIYN